MACLVKVCMWVCLPVEVFVVKIPCWEVSSRDTPLPPPSCPPQLTALWWGGSESTIGADNDSCVCDTSGLHTWFVRLLRTARDFTLRPVDQSTPPTPPHPCRRALQSQASGISGLSALLDPLSLLTPPPQTPQVNCSHAHFRQARRLLEAFARVECPALRCRRDRAPVQLRQKSQPLAVGTTRSEVERE